jgi:putative membrane protein
MMWPGWGMGGWSMAIWVFFGVVLTALVVVAVLALLRLAKGSGLPGQPATPSSPEQLLAQRYARGEIDEDEYTQRRQVLQASQLDARQDR